jgi:hypothetical protein
MPSPFPGMDPYIEMPRIWSDFHNGLADEIRAELNRTIRPTYFAALTPYVTYDTIEVTQRKTEGIRPDISVWKTSNGPLATLVAPQVATAPVESLIALELPLELFSVEIRMAADDFLVTSIEILSPVNKRRGHEAHIDYLRKRRELLRSATHLIEIDLLRAGVRPPLDQPVPLAPYYVMLSRATHRPHVSVWPITLDARLPTIPVPLLEPDPDVALDLAAVVASVYERGGYDARIDYRQPVPSPALSAAEMDWAESLLAPLRTTTR